MNIGIIGSGCVGVVLAKKLIAINHQVFIANSRGPASLTAIAKETGAIPVTTKRAIEKSDLVIIAIPEKNITDLPTDLFSNAPQNIVVIDAGNYYPTRDGIIYEIENELTESEWVQKQLKKQVVKAFNSITADSLAKKGRTEGTTNRIAIPICSDNQLAKLTVEKLINDMGYDVYDQGELKNSWRQQPGSPVYCTDLTLPHLTKRLDKLGSIRTPSVRKEMEELRDAQRKFYENYQNNKFQVPFSLIAVLFIMLRQRIFQTLRKCLY